MHVGTALPRAERGARRSPATPLWPQPGLGALPSPLAGLPFLHGRGVGCRAECWWAPCSAEELETCSLKVLEPRGSPTQCLLQLLAERDCTLKYLLGCLERMGHTQACQVLSSAGRDGRWGPTGPGEGHRGTWTQQKESTGR